jgi:hypothetical protein
MKNKIMQGELSSAAESKLIRYGLEIDANKKLKKGEMASGEFAKKKSKSKVDSKIFSMAEERDY